MSGMLPARDHGRRELIGFFTLAYGITWVGIFGFLWSIRFDFAAIGIPEAMAMFALMLLGPSAGALILVAADGGWRGIAALLAGVGRVRVPWRWYAVALLTTPLLLLAVLVPLSAWVSPIYMPSFLVVGVVAGLMAGAIEELGWTGYATPRLLARFSPLKAGLILGLAWAVWHGLADFAGSIGTSDVGEWAVRMLIMWIVPLTGYRVLMTWAYSRHRSLALGMLMHASYTGWLAALTMEMAAAPGVEALLWQSIFATMIWLAVAVAAVRSRGGITAGRREPAFSSVEP